MLLYDNLKSAVLARRGGHVQRLVELSAHYRFAPSERARGTGVHYVRDLFWAGRTFTTLAECNRQAWRWRDDVDHQRRWPGGGRSLRRGTATPHAACPASVQHGRIEAVCSRKAIYVRFDLNDYSIPPDAVGRPLTLAASDTTVRLLQ